VQNGKIDVLRRPRMGAKTKVHRKAALQKPRTSRVEEEPRKEALDHKLQLDRTQGDPYRDGMLSQVCFK
jgi:hypothetical protein